MADFASDEVLARAYMTVIERVHLPEFDFFHLEPKILVLLLDLYVAFGLNGCSLGIVEARLRGALGYTPAQGQGEAFLSRVLNSLLVVHVLHLLAFDIQETTSLDLTRCLLLHHL